MTDNHSVSIIVSNKNLCDNIYKLLLKNYKLSVQKFYSLKEFKNNFSNCLSLIITDFDINQLSDFIGIKIIKINENLREDLLDLEIKKLKETKLKFNDLLREHYLKLEIESNRYNIENLDNLIFHLLNRFWLTMTLEFKYSLTTILKESITNAFYHGNFNIDSSIKLKENGFTDFYDIVEKKQDDERFKTKKVFIKLKFSSSKLLISVEDEGKGFDLEKIKYKENKTLEEA